MKEGVGLWYSKRVYHRVTIPFTRKLCSKRAYHRVTIPFTRKLQLTEDSYLDYDLFRSLKGLIG